MRIQTLRHELSRAGLLEGKTPWVIVTVGSDSLPHVNVVNPSKVFQPIENRLVSELRKLSDLPSGSSVVIADAHDHTPDGLRRGLTISTDPPSLAARITALVDVLVLSYADAVKADDPRIVRTGAGYAYYQTSMEIA